MNRLAHVAESEFAETFDNHSCLLNAHANFLNPERNAGDYFAPKPEPTNVFHCTEACEAPRSDFAVTRPGDSFPGGQKRCPNPKCQYVPFDSCMYGLEPNAEGDFVNRFLHGTVLYTPNDKHNGTVTDTAEPFPSDSTEVKLQSKCKRSTDALIYNASFTTSPRNHVIIQRSAVCDAATKLCNSSYDRSLCSFRRPARHADNLSEEATAEWPRFYIADRPDRAGRPTPPVSRTEGYPRRESPGSMMESMTHSKLKYVAERTNCGHAPLMHALSIYIGQLTALNLYWTCVYPQSIQTSAYAKGTAYCSPDPRGQLVSSIHRSTARPGIPTPTRMEWKKTAGTSLVFVQDALTYSTWSISDRMKTWVTTSVFGFWSQSWATTTKLHTIVFVCLICSANKPIFMSTASQLHKHTTVAYTLHTMDYKSPNKMDYKHHI